jgi:hypothetical protein
MDLSKVYNPNELDYSNRSELDSHIDTCVAGSNTVPIWYTDHKVSVSPFIGEYVPLDDIPVASVATAWDDPLDGSTVILIINEALYFGDRMSYSLLCPNQLRFNGIIVNDTPTIFDPKSSHSIIIPGELELPLKMRGVLSYLETRKPSEQELLTCDRYELTSSACWDPYSLQLEEVENNHPGTTTSPWHRGVDMIESVMACMKLDPPELSGINFIPRLVCSTKVDEKYTSSNGRHEADVIAHEEDYRLLMALDSKSKTTNISKEDLAKRWHIGLEAAARTLLATSQLGMRFVDGPLERRLKTSQAHMRFPTLDLRIYSDTLFSQKKSIRGFPCAQVFMDGKCFCWVYPLRSKGDAHQALMQFIQDVGIPKELLTDCALEEMRGEWGRILKQYHIGHCMTQPKSPWQNRAEAEIRELKKLVRRTLRHSNAPTEFWCYAIEWAAKIRSLTAHDLPSLRSRTPEERIIGHTPDISEYAHFSWFEWVWFREQISFPGADLCLRRWLGVANNVGQAMTYWILTEKGSIIARSSVIPVSDHEKRDTLQMQRQDAFMSRLLEIKDMEMVLNKFSYL